MSRRGGRDPALGHPWTERTAAGGRNIDTGPVRGAHIYSAQKASQPAAECSIIGRINVMLVLLRIFVLYFPPAYKQDHAEAMAINIKN